MVKVRLTIRYPRSFCALIVTCLPVTDWVGVPEMTPVLELSVSPVGRVPEVTEKTIHSPVTAGVAEKEMLLGRANEDCGYAKDEMGRSTVKVREVVFVPKSFCALMVTSRSETDWEGVPEMTPVLEFSVSPVGSDPDTIEYVIDSPIMCGEMEKETLLGIT